MSQISLAHTEYLWRELYDQSLIFLLEKQCVMEERVSHILYLWNKPDEQI